MNDAEDLWNYALENGKKKTAELLRKYATDGEPEGFMPGYTSRAMSRFASMGIEGTPLEQDTGSYLETPHGTFFYSAMWGNDPIPEDDE